MKTSDRHLVLIVAAILVLAAAAVAVTLLRPAQEYRAGDAPEGVVYNYLLALQNGDFERAYGYLSPGLAAHPPDVSAFTGEIHDQSRRYGRDAGAVSLQVGTGLVTGSRAEVSARVTVFREGGLFDSGEYTNDLSFRLQLEDGGWRLIAADAYGFWAECWEWEAGCR